MRKFILGLLAAPAAVFAQESAPTAFDTALSDLQTGVTGMINKVAPVVGAIVVALLVIVGIWFAWKQVRRGLGR